MFNNYVHQLIGVLLPVTRNRPQQRLPKFRPSLEALEDRTVPSSFWQGAVSDFDDGLAETSTAVISTSEESTNSTFQTLAFSTRSAHVNWDNLLGLYVSEGGYFQNAFGFQEKWLRGELNNFGNVWYFILPDGRFFEWSGAASLTGNQLDQFSPDFHRNAELLHEASDLQLDSVGASVAEALDRSLGLHVDVTGFHQNVFGGNEKWLRGEVHQFGNPWYFIAPDGRFFEWNGTASLNGHLRFDFQTTAVHLKPELLFEASEATLDATAADIAQNLDERFGLYVDAGGFSQNAFGLNEKWLRGVMNRFGNPWYAILPNGEFIEWSGTPGVLTGVSHGVLGTAAHRNPELVFQAANFALDPAHVDLAVTLDQQHGFHVDVRGLQENAFGDGERWLRGEVHGLGNPWYFVLPDGRLFAWSGVAGQLTGAVLADFSPAFHLSPELIHRAFSL